ncbi:MAG: tetratricopeptide repeat protein [Phycisphaerales bacterium]
MSSPRFQQALADFNAQRYDKAEATLRAAMRSNPSDIESLALLAGILLEKGQLDQSEFFFNRALALHPQSGLLRGNYGDLLAAKGQREAALATYEQAVELEPESGRLWACLATAYQEAGRFTEAIEAGRRGCELDPSDPWHFSNWAAAYGASGLSAETIDIYDRGLAMHPSAPQLLQGRIANANYQPAPDLQARAREQMAYAARLCAAVPPEQPVFKQSRDPERPLRIGFFSPDLRRHSVAYFVTSFLPHINRARYSIYAYQYSITDEYSKKVANDCTKFRHVNRLTDIALARQIRDDQIDVLIDLAGHTTASRLPVMVRRCAPVQCSWIGYPATTGCRNIDYRIVDAITDPPEAEVDALCTEELIRLDRCFICFKPPEHAPEPVATLNRPLTFVSQNNLQKITDHALGVWARVLNAVPGSRLYVKNFGCKDPVVAARLRQRVAAAGADPARVEIDAYVDDPRRHFERFGNFDIALDTWPYNGTTTTCETLWMGVPVVTIKGNSHVSRVGESLMRAVGLDEFVAKDEDDYVRIAATLAGDDPRRRELRAALRPRLASSPLCDGAAMARSLESALRTVWRRWCAANLIPG